MAENEASVQDSVITSVKLEYKLPEVMVSKGALVLANADNKDKGAIASAMKEIDIDDTQSIISFGIVAQRQLSTVAEQMLEGVRNKETGAAGDVLNDMVATLRGFDMKDIAGNKQTGILAFLKGLVNPLVKAVQRYEKVKHQIDAMEDMLEGHVTNLMRDIEALDRLYDSSLDYFHQLAIYIAAGEEVIRLLDEETIPALKKEAEDSNDLMVAQNLNDIINARNVLERKVHDLKLSRQVIMQSLPSIRIVQDNDNNLVTKIQSSIVNTIPLWKTQMAQALTIQRSAAAGKAVKATHDLTNELLESNAKTLKNANAQIRKEVERGMFDIASIELANQNLIDTITESIVIYEQGKEQRKEVEKRLVECESALRERLKDLKHIK